MGEAPERVQVNGVPDLVVYLRPYGQKGKSAWNVGKMPSVISRSQKRNALRMNLFQAQDEVGVRREKLIDEIEARLQQRLEKSELFLLRWEII